MGNAWTIPGTIRKPPTTCFPPPPPGTGGIISGFFEVTPAESASFAGATVNFNCNNNVYPPLQIVALTWNLPGLFGTPPGPYHQPTAVPFETNRNGIVGNYVGTVLARYPNGTSKLFSYAYKNLPILPP